MTRPPTFRQKNGLTAYAMACGYIQRACYGELCVDLWHEGACYHVRAFDFDLAGRLMWESFDTLTDARKAWAEQVRRHLGGVIKAAKADRRYTVAVEHTGERDPFFVARQGRGRDSWVGKSETEQGAWLLVAAARGLELATC